MSTHSTSLLLHGFGARYDLPISLALYLYGAAAVVVVSFLLVVVFAGNRSAAESTAYPRWQARWLAALAGSRAVRAVGGAAGVLCLLAVVVTGWWGAPNPLQNPAAYLVWIYLWVGLVVVTGLLGNVWRLLNPFATLYDVAAAVLRLPSRLAVLPARLGVWPACLVFFAIAWLELASGRASTPSVIAAAALAYTVLTLAGMVVFGRNEWLERCEAFTVLFGVVSRFGPVEVERDAGGRPVGAWLRPWGVGLLQPVAAGWDRVVFVVLMLSNLAFDGIEATPFWFGIASSLTLGPSWRPVIYTVGLLGTAVVFLAVFTVFMRLVLYFGVTEVDVAGAMTAFAFTLVPIALVYDVAHNYSYLVLQGQGLIPLLADPLGRGWNLLPLRGYVPDGALNSPATVWLMQVVLIVLGHVMAVYLAHRRATQQFVTYRNALISQYPMLVLMVGYTMTSLWILAQPTTSG